MIRVKVDYNNSPDRIIFKDDAGNKYFLNNKYYYYNNRRKNYYWDSKHKYLKDFLKEIAINNQDIFILN